MQISFKNVQHFVRCYLGSVYQIKRDVLINYLFCMQALVLPINGQVSIGLWKTGQNMTNRHKNIHVSILFVHLQVVLHDFLPIK